MSTGAKIALGTVAVVGALAAADALFNKSRNLKKIFGMADDAAKPHIDDATSKVESNSTRVKAVKPKSPKVIKNEAIRDGKITEYTIRDEGNIIRVKDGEIVSYTNAQGEDLMHTFDEVRRVNTEYNTGINELKARFNAKELTDIEYQSEFSKLEKRFNEQMNSADKEYLNKIQNLINNVSFKEKEALAYLDDVIIEGLEAPLKSKDIARYIKNKSMPMSRGNSDVFYDGNTKVSIHRVCNKKHTVHVYHDKYHVAKQYHNNPDEVSVETVLNHKVYRSFDGVTSKIVNKRKDGIVEVIQRCNESGEVLPLDKIYEGNTGTHWLRRVIDTNAKGKEISSSIIDAPKEEFISTITHYQV